MSPAGRRIPFQAALRFLCFALAACFTAIGSSGSPTNAPGAEVRTFVVKGIIRELPVGGTNVVVRHETIAGYMDAMTMPFAVRDPDQLGGLHPGDTISFRLVVGPSESWIEQIVRLASNPEKVSASPPSKTGTRPQHPLMDVKFTNELGQAVSLSDFRGQALAITFFFTRCPIPEFCPRLSKNFQEASQKLLAMTNATGNWHFLSISFDPAFDTPAVLKAYAERYHYDARHWSFLTGPTNELRQLAAESDVKVEPDGAFFNHNFRTLVIDASGRLQMVFPTGGDLSESLVNEILKAAVVTNR